MPFSCPTVIRSTARAASPHDPATTLCMLVRPAKPEERNWHEAQSLPADASGRASCSSAEVGEVGVRPSAGRCDRPDGRCSGRTRDPVVYEGRWQAPGASAKAAARCNGGPMQASHTGALVSLSAHAAWQPARTAVVRQPRPRPPAAVGTPEGAHAAPCADHASPLPCRPDSSTSPRCGAATSSSSSLCASRTAAAPGPSRRAGEPASLAASAPQAAPRIGGGTCTSSEPLPSPSSWQDAEHWR